MSLDNVKNILLVLSGKGGVGKSSVATQLALSLSLQGHAVGILDIDLTGPSIPRFLGIETARIKMGPGGWLPVEVHGAQTLGPAPPLTYPGSGAPPEGQGGDGIAKESTECVEKSPNMVQKRDSGAPSPPSLADTESNASITVGPLCAMSLAFLLASRSSAVVWRGPKKTAMVRQFLSDVLWPRLDYLLIDTPPGTSDEHISLVETLLTQVATVGAARSSPDPEATSTATSNRPNLAGAVIVTTPQAVAVSDVRKEINFCAKTKVPIVGVVENMSGYVCPCCGVATNIFSKGGGQVMADDFGLQFLGSIPIDGLWGRLVEEGIRPVYGIEPNAQENKAENGNGREDNEDEDMDSSVGDQGEDEDNLPEFPLKDQEREPGLLVDKYRNCSLAPGFASIAKAVTEIVTKGASIRVGATTS